MVHDMYLYQVKKPEESKKDWDYYNVSRHHSGDEAFIKRRRTAAARCVAK